MSVVALDAAAIGPGEACMSGGSAPCEIERIGLTYGCSDGIDNDNDGLADADDPQCYDALGAEDASGVGRRPLGACADGLDDDDDGLIDRADPGCRVAGDAENREQERAIAACANGADDDADGLVDALDPDCYGPLDATELGIAAGGYASIGVDEIGLFAYVADPSERQVLVVDLERRRLVDAPRARDRVDAFADPLGIVVGATPLPSAVAGRVARTVTPLSSSAHALIRYDIGAHVVADNAFVYFADVATVYCEVYETRAGGTLSGREFFDDRDALAASNEASCLALDPLLAALAPEAAGTDEDRACSVWRGCERCLAQTDREPAPSLTNCAGCAGLEEAEAASLADRCAPAGGADRRLRARAPRRQRAPGGARRRQPRRRACSGAPRAPSPRS